MKQAMLTLSLLGMLMSCSSNVKEEETRVIDLEERGIQRQGLPAGFDVEGHRGARGLKPENTLPAFETALDLGVDTLELDLHLTSDNVVVIWHDDRIERDKCRLDPEANLEVPDPDSFIKWGDALMISQMTSAELRAYLCDRNPDPDVFPDQDNDPMPLAGADFHIPTLAGLFEFVEQYGQSELKSSAQRDNAMQVQFNVETKRKPDKPKAIGDSFDGVNPGMLEIEVLRLIERFGVAERVIIQSFDHRSLWAIRSADDKIRLSVLTSGGDVPLTGYAAKGASIWSPRYTTLSPTLVSEAHAVGLEVIPWTVNDAVEMTSLISMGVDGIISDRPDVLLTLER